MLHEDEKNMFICSNCEKQFNNNEDNNVKNFHYCDDCYNNLPKCEKCDEVLTNEDINEFKGNSYCSDCYNEIPCCEECGEKIDTINDNYYYVEDVGMVCENCIEEYSFCESCQKHFNNDDIIRTSDCKHICADCIDKTHFKCNECGEFCPYEDSNTDYDNNYICDDCRREYFFQCERCDQLFPNDQESCCSNLCDDCYQETGGEDEEGIYPYEYKPEPCFKRYDGEYTKLFIGVELEIRGADRSCCAYDLNNNIDFVYCKHDSSIGDNGVEIVSHPGTFDFHTKTNIWNKIFDILENNGMDNIENCGLHFHISRNFFTEEAIRVLDYFVNNNPEFIANIGGRKLDGYCSSREKDMNNWGMSYSSRHCDAVNLTNSETIELRFCKSTPDYTTFMKRLNFIHDIVNFSMNVTFKEIITEDNIKMFESFLESNKSMENVEILEVAI